VRGVRNLVSSAPRTPRLTDLNSIPVPESYVSRDNAAGSQVQQAKDGHLTGIRSQAAQTLV
jgi:hypothetical protein